MEGMARLSVEFLGPASVEPTWHWVLTGSSWGNLGSLGGPPSSVTVTGQGLLLVLNNHLPCHVDRRFPLRRSLRNTILSTGDKGPARQHTLGSFRSRRTGVSTGWSSPSKLSEEPVSRVIFPATVVAPLELWTHRIGILPPRAYANSVSSCYFTSARITRVRPTCYLFLGASGETVEGSSWTRLTMNFYIATCGIASDFQSKCYQIVGPAPHPVRETRGAASG